jgi:inhibitor of the pro-sigma K processing machinery
MGKRAAVDTQIWGWCHLNEALPWIATACGLFALVLFFNKAFMKLVKLCVRGAVGGIGFFAVNSILGAVGMSLAVGINAVTVIVTAFLGLPGFLLLYAIQLVLK